MIRVLHLLDSSADEQARLGSGQLCAHMGAGDFDVAVRTIGPGGSFGNVASAAWGLRGDARAADLVHAFGLKALTAAALSPARRILFSPTEFPSRRQAGWIRAIAQYRRLDVICPTASTGRALAKHGLAPGQIHLVRPGIDFSRLRRKRNPELRATLGFADTDIVILAPGASTRSANHRLAVWAAAILNFMDPRYRLLLWGNGGEVPALRRFARGLAQASLLTWGTEKLGRTVAFDELLGAADVVVVPANGPVSTLPIAMCMAAALPIAATVTPTVAELLEDRHTALMVPPDVPRFLARKVIQLREDSGLAWKLADMARTEAFEFFAQTRFVDQWRTAYTQAAPGGAIAIPEPAPGAGMRFHGRG